MLLTRCLASVLVLFVFAYHAYYYIAIMRDESDVSESLKNFTRFSYSAATLFFLVGLMSIASG